jgi:hypothetical protein
MQEGYEPRRYRGLGIAVAVVAVVEVLILGGILLGFLLVLDRVLLVAGIATAVPGLVVVGRGFGGALRVALTNDPAGLALAWRRTVFASLFLVAPIVAWAVIAVSLRSSS